MDLLTAFFIQQPPFTYFNVFTLTPVLIIGIFAWSGYSIYKGFNRESLILLEQNLTQKLKDDLKESSNQLENKLVENHKRFAAERKESYDLFAKEVTEEFTALEKKLEESEQKVAELTAVKLRQIDEINMLKQELKLAS